MARNLTLTVLLMLGSANSTAQDLRKVVQIVDEMETSLRKSLASEQDQRKADVAALRQEIDLLKLSRGTSVSADTVETGAPIAKQWDQLERRIAVLENRIEKTSGDVVQLTQAVSLLVNELKKSLR